MRPYVPDQIENCIKGMKIKEIKEGHCSGDLIYKIGDKYILKVSLLLWKISERTI